MRVDFNQAAIHFVDFGALESVVVQPGGVIAKYFNLGLYFEAFLFKGSENVAVVRKAVAGGAEKGGARVVGESVGGVELHGFVVEHQCRIAAVQLKVYVSGKDVVVGVCGALSYKIAHFVQHCRGVGIHVVKLYFPGCQLHAGSL